MKDMHFENSGKLFQDDFAKELHLHKKAYIHIKEIQNTNLIKAH